MNIMSRYQQLLREMGVSQWQLVRPECLKGIVNIPINDDIRIIILSEDEAVLEPLLQDVLHSLSIEENQYLLVNFDLAPHLNIDRPVIYWVLGDESEKMDETLSYFELREAVWRSPNWQSLARNPQAKRQLWRQIQEIYS